MKILFKRFIGVYVFLFSILSFSQVTEHEPPVEVPPKQELAKDYDENVPYAIAIVDEPPRIEACYEISKADVLKCLNEQLQLHVKKHLNYPEEAKKEGIQGRVAVTFIIDKDGNCIDFKARGPQNGQLLEEEAIRIMKLLPKFTPGKTRGNIVNVHHAAVVLFQLEKKNKRG